MQKAEAIRQKEGVTYNLENDTFEGIDLTQFSDEELAALGIDPSEVDRGDPEEDEEELDEEEDDEEDDESDRDDGEDDDEGDESEDDDEDEEEEEKDIRIPKSRFDEAVGKEREKVKAAEERAAWLESQINKLIELQANKGSEKVEQIEEQAADVDDLEAEYVNKILEGEVDEAKKIRKQINQIQEKRISSLLEETKKNAKEEARNLSEQEKFDIAVQKSVVEYPFLDPDHETYNEELVIDINALSKGYVQSGTSSAQALEKAVKKLAEPYKKSLEKPKKSTTKKTTQREAQKADKKAKQPPNTKSGKVKSLTPDDIDWDNMSEAEFDKLYKENPKLITKYLNETHL